MKQANREHRARAPVVGAIVTNPLVLADGTLLAPDGLDRERRAVFKIEHALRDLLPKPAECTPNAVGRARISPAVVSLKCVYSL